jgi:hypothetical protein
LFHTFTSAAEIFNQCSRYLFCIFKRYLSADYFFVVIFFFTNFCGKEKGAAGFFLGEDGAFYAHFHVTLACLHDYISFHS